MPVPTAEQIQKKESSLKKTLAAQGESMEPAYERGNLLLVNPASSVSPGDDCLFLRETSDGTRYALVKRLVRVNEQSWTVRQYNPPKTYALARKELQKAHLVIGKYNRAS